MKEKNINIFKKGISIDSNLFWLITGFLVFIFIAFVIPTPESLIEVVHEYGFSDNMIKTGVADSVTQAAWKAKLILGIIPMATIFFCTEAIPIGLVGILMPFLAYFFYLLPKAEIGKTFCGDAPLFLLGVLALGVVVTEVGLHKRLASWILGWVKGFIFPLFIIAISMSLLGAFVSAHAIAAFMTPIMVAIYVGALKGAKDKGSQIEEDPNLAKLLLFTLCFSLNVGGVGSPAAGGRNAIMMGFFDNYNVSMSFTQWMAYGMPLVPILAIAVVLYLLFVFRKTSIKDLTPGFEDIKKENIQMGSMKISELLILLMMFVILFLWITKSDTLGLGGPALLALMIPVIFRIVDWKKILSNISWNAWFMYCGALTMGALLQNSGAALWLARFFLNSVQSLGINGELPLLVGASFFSGVMTNFMSDAATTSLLGPITVPMGILSGGAGEPWAVGLATAFATSFANFLIVGTPNNAIIYALSAYPGTDRRIIHPLDFLRYGFVLWIICMLILWVVGFLIIFRIVGFPPDITESAKAVLEATRNGIVIP
ncbi:MAG: SLC13 family permease [Atribacterota bacterium]|nr:SLC13 family permease [Atribacterota bacterium]